MSHRRHPSSRACSRGLSLAIVLALASLGHPVATQAIAVYPFGPSGGQGGEPFSHLSSLLGLPFSTEPASPQVSQVAVRAGALIDGINIGWTLPNGTMRYAQWAGGTGGMAYTFDLPRGEHIVAVTGTYGQFLNQIKFHTSSGRESPLYGADAGPIAYEYKAPPSCRIVGLHGHAGVFVDSVGVYLMCPER